MSHHKRMRLKGIPKVFKIIGIENEFKNHVNKNDRFK